MKYLSPHQVLFLHSRLIEETGGSHGVRDMGLLLSALGRPQATFEEKDLHTTIYVKAAAVAEFDYQQSSVCGWEQAHWYWSSGNILVSERLYDNCLQPGTPRSHDADCAKENHDGRGCQLV